MYSEITKDEINALELIKKLDCQGCGSIIEFHGVVRPDGELGEIMALYYDYHESMAPKILNEVLSEAIGKFSLIDGVVIHRVGLIPVGETSLFIALSSKHRKEALSGMEWLIDRIKTRVPIWKKDIYKNGSYWHQ